MQQAAEAEAASPELCIHVSTLLPFPHMQNPSTAQVSFKSSIPSKPVSSLEVFKGPKNTSRQARRLSLPHQQLHIACFHFPGTAEEIERAWYFQAAHHLSHFKGANGTAARNKKLQSCEICSLTVHHFQTSRPTPKRTHGLHPDRQEPCHSLHAGMCWDKTHDAKEEICSLSGHSDHVPKRQPHQIRQQRRMMLVRGVKDWSAKLQLNPCFSPCAVDQLPPAGNRGKTIYTVCTAPAFGHHSFKQTCSKPARSESDYLVTAGTSAQGQQGAEGVKLRFQLNLKPQQTRCIFYCTQSPTAMAQPIPQGTDLTCRVLAPDTRIHLCHAKSPAAKLQCKLQGLSISGRRNCGFSPMGEQCSGLLQMVKCSKPVLSQGAPEFVSCYGRDFPCCDSNWRDAGTERMPPPEAPYRKNLKREKNGLYIDSSKWEHAITVYGNIRESLNFCFRTWVNPFLLDLARHTFLGGSKKLPLPPQTQDTHQGHRGTRSAPQWSHEQVQVTQHGGEASSPPEIPTSCFILVYGPPSSSSVFAEEVILGTNDKQGTCQMSAHACSAEVFGESVFRNRPSDLLPEGGKHTPGEHVPIQPSVFGFSGQQEATRPFCRFWMLNGNPAWCSSLLRPAAVQCLYSRDPFSKLLASLQADKRSCNIGSKDFNTRSQGLQCPGAPAKQLNQPVLSASTHGASTQSWGGHSRDVIAGTCSYVGALLLLTSCKWKIQAAIPNKVFFHWVVRKSDGLTRFHHRSLDTIIVSPQLMEEKVRMLSPTICMQDVHGCECSWQQYEHVKDPTQAGGSEHNSKPEDIELLLTPIPLVYSSSSLRTSSMFVFGCLPIISPKAASAHCTPSLYIELVYWLISCKLCSLILGAAFLL
ncbi:hypothetical protein Anapl_05783 [Anas platyrhynchos]|uniref:Uncharacterized protein n=1 Tax=Anas platyrhynchos TaxID=8839 RepID=R0KDB6_ANAPL|nr:hypothetical protein Anapl_05783 [Anas platyrhynchos]